jgi:hypothetical protein
MKKSSNEFILLILVVLVIIIGVAIYFINRKENYIGFEGVRELEEAADSSAINVLRKIEESPSQVPARPPKPPPKLPPPRTKPLRRYSLSEPYRPHPSTKPPYLREPTPGVVQNKPRIRHEGRKIGSEIEFEHTPKSQ